MIMQSIDTKADASEAAFTCVPPTCINVKDAPYNAKGDGRMNGNDTDAIMLAQEDETSTQYVKISSNYVDLGWWLIKDIYHGEGSTVSYIPETVTKPAMLKDTSANFTQLSKYYREGSTNIGHNIRAMPVKHKAKEHLVIQLLRIKMPTLLLIISVSTIS